MVIVGVLALQGGFQEHLDLLSIAAKTVLSDEDFTAMPVRTVAQLGQCDALIIPGGESTSMTLLANNGGLMQPLREFVRIKPVWGTCAGMIMLADEVAGGALSEDPTGKAIGGFPFRVIRNQYGRQTESFEHPIHIEGLRNAEQPFPAIFIRAPITHSRLTTEGDSISILASIPLEALPSSRQTTQAPTTRQVIELGPDATAVVMRRGKMLVSSFHPELTEDPRVHELFLRSVVKPGVGLAEQEDG